MTTTRKPKGRWIAVEVSVDVNDDSLPADEDAVADAFFDWLHAAADVVEPPGWLFSIDGIDPLHIGYRWPSGSGTAVGPPPDQ